MKHLKNLYKFVKFYLLNIPRDIENLLFPDRVWLRKKQGERILLMKQLQSNIDMAREVNARASRNQALDLTRETKRLEMQEKFLGQISTCDLDDFETLAQVWIMRMRKV